jgi:OFA family oxalate/formate antiporter-like MFS transporter
LAFVLLTGFAFFAWGEIFSLFPATIADVFGPRYASTNYGVQYTAKGLAAIFAAWGAAHIVGIFGSWIPILWAAPSCATSPRPASRSSASSPSSPRR